MKGSSGMSQDEKKTDNAEETSQIGRRELLTKVAAAAGAIAASGMLASALSTEAEAQTIKASAVQRTGAMRPQLVSDAPLKYAKLSNGHEMTVGAVERHSRARRLALPGPARQEQRNDPEAGVVITIPMPRA
jgi:hypothetical protein